MSRFNIDNTYVSIEDTRFYFTKASVRLCELQAGQYIHFLNDGSDWHFYTNDDPDGFLIAEGPRKRGVLVCNVALVRMFRKSTGFNHRISFYIKKTFAVYDKCPVFKIDIMDTVIHN